MFGPEISSVLSKGEAGMGSLGRPRSQAFAAERGVTGDLSQLSPCARTLHDYWWTLSRRGGIPRRTCFDPIRVVPILPHLGICERRSDDDWFIRLAGTAVAQRLGRDVTGRNYLDLVAPAVRERTALAIACVIGWPCGVRSIRCSRATTGRLVAVETLGLPLRAPDGEARLVVWTNFVLKDETENREGELVDGEVLAVEYLDIGAGRPPSDVTVPDLRRRAGFR